MNKLKSYDMTCKELNITFLNNFNEGGKLYYQTIFIKREFAEKVCLKIIHVTKSK